jgi:hypothetical protein
MTAVPYRDPDTYLKALEDETRQIRIKGLRTKRAEPYFFGIDVAGTSIRRHGRTSGRYTK